MINWRWRAALRAFLLHYIVAFILLLMSNLHLFKIYNYISWKLGGHLFGLSWQLVFGADLVSNMPLVVCCELLSFSSCFWGTLLARFLNPDLFCLVKRFISSWFRTETLCVLCSHEGRSWYSSHRGILWIASTAKPPQSSEVAAVEDFYRKFYSGLSRFDFIQFFLYSNLVLWLGMLKPASVDYVIAFFAKFSCSLILFFLVC